MAEVSYDIPTCLPDASNLMVAAQRLVKIPEIADREEAVQTLFKLIHGVLANPEEPKKRKVRKANEAFHRKLGRYSAGLEFLKGCGFVEATEGDEEVLTMPVAFIARITDAHHTLARSAQEAGLPVPPMPGSTFNPYQSNVRNMDTKGTQASEAWKSEADQIREEVKKRQRELKEKVDQAPPVDLRPTAFWLSAGRRLEEVVNEAAQVVEDRTTDNALLQAQVASAKAAIAGSNAKFESADKKRLAELRGKRVHEFCVLRVICPDKSVLQVHFRAGDPGHQVMTSVAPLLAPHVRESSWYLYQSPPLKRLEKRETLAAAGFTPGANLYLGFDGQKPAGPFLSDSMVAQLGPAPEEGQRGVNAVAGPTFSGEAMGWGQGQRLGGPASAQGPSLGQGHRLGGSAPAPAQRPAPAPGAMQD